jgi:HlyD family secretion protein
MLRRSLTTREQRMAKLSPKESRGHTEPAEAEARASALPEAPVAKTRFGRILVAGLVALACLFIGLGGWMAVTKISGAVVAAGMVAIKGEMKTVQHLDGGIVTEIEVANGDVVRTGDVLVRLDRTLLEAYLNVYRNRLGEALARRARLEAERDGRMVIAWPDAANSPLGVVPEDNVRLSQERLLKVRRDNREGQVAQLNGKIAQYRNQIDGVAGLKASKLQQVALIDRELVGLKALYKKGNTTLNRLLSLERQKSDLLGQRADLDAQNARISNLISEARIQIVQIDREFREKVLSELRSTEQETNELVQQLYTTREKLNRVVVRAPVGGVVHQLQVHTIGGVVAPGGALMRIVPTEQAVEINANIEPQFIDEVSVGQKATLRFVGFNRHKTPDLFGRVQSVSPSSLSNEKTGASFYIAQIEVSKAELDKLGGRHRLVAGMPVETYIRKDDRTVLSYIVRPLRDQIYRAFREE